MNPQCPVGKRITLALAAVLAFSVIEAKAAAPQSEVGLPAAAAQRPAAAAPRPAAGSHRPAAASQRPAAAPQRPAAARPRTAANPSLYFFTLPPCRVFDSRLPADAPSLQVGVERIIQVGGSCGVPADAKAVAVNATALGETAAGALALYPGDGTANLNLISFPAHRILANNAVVELSGTGDGTLKALYSAGSSGQTTNLIVDVSGYMADPRPIAVDDSYATSQNTALNQAAPGVLANDTLKGGAIFSYGATTGSEQTTIGAATPTSAGGSITLNADGSFSYTPANGFVGADTFKYVLHNAFGSSTATVTINVGKQNQTITFTSTAPAGAKVGGPTYNVTATASSGLTVTFTIDAAAASVCSISGSTVSFTGAGTCVIDANQAGNATYNPAPQKQQSFPVAKGDQTITFTSTAPGGAKVGGPKYNVTATASSGLTVTFTIDASSASVCSISGSMVSFIAVGTCVIDANQAGDANWNAAPQVQQSFAVAKGDQTITFTSTPPPSAQVGGPTYNVTATASSGLTVTFTIDPPASSVCSISGSTVSFIGTGTCIIDANQAGDANWNAAPQAQQSFGVGKSDQTITFTSTAPAGAKVGGPAYNVTATASSGLTVTFTIDAAAASVCSISGSTVSFIGAGTCVIDANQAGNGTYNPAPQAQQSFPVAKGDQTITFTSTPPASATVGGPTYTVTATATSGLPVAFSIDASASGVCSITGSASTRARQPGAPSGRPPVGGPKPAVGGSRLAVGGSRPTTSGSSATVSFTGVGTCVIDANQAGDSNWNAAPQVQQSFAVGKGDQTITFTSTAPAAAKVSGPPYNVTATASSGLSPTFTIDASATSVCSISGSTVSFTAAGTCVIDANQAGDSNYNAAPQAQQSFAVGKGDQTITFTSTAPAGAKVGGTAYNVTATATSGLTVTFSIDASATSVCSISGSTVSFIGAGTCVIDANQAGDSNYNPAPQVQQSFPVAKGDQTITFTSTAPANAKVGGPTYTVTATATSGLPVTFTVDPAASGVCSVTGSAATRGRQRGAASGSPIRGGRGAQPLDSSATVSFLTTGTCIIDANQAGDTNWNAAAQVQQSFAVAKGDQTITFTSAAPANAKNGGPTYTVTATASSGLTPVTFSIDASATSVCSISGSTVSFIGGGTCVIDANQAGDSNWNPAPQKQQSFPVAKADQTITITSTAPTNATPGVGSYTVTATATSGLTVTFTIDASASSVCSISGSTVSFTADGTCVIDANQAGDANYNAAPQVQQSFKVDTPPTVTSTIPANNATNVALASTISITFSKSVNVTGSAFQLACSPGTAPSFTVTPASPATTYVLHPSASLPFDSSCTVTVVASQVTDVSASRNMTANYMFSFATPPIANADTYPETLIGNVSINSANAVPAYSVTANDQFNSPITITAFDATSANGGTVSMTTSGAGIGRFTYSPAAGFAGADTFTYTIGNANGSSTATVHLTVSGVIWFIDKSAGAGDGRLSSPFNSLASFQAVNDGAACNALNTPRCHPAANANIFLYDNASAYTGPVVLLNGQKLIGQDATSSLSAISGLTPGASSAALPSTGGGSPNKVSITATGNDVTLGSGNTVWGMSLGNATGGIALSGASVGSLKIRDLTINTTGGAVSLASGALDAIIKSVTSGGGTHGISLTSTTGSFDVEGDGASDPANTTRGRTTAKNGGGTLGLGSGGTIQSATSSGVLLSTATSVTLRNIVIQNNGSGVKTGTDGITVTNGLALVLDNTVITGHAGNNGLHATSLAGLTIEHSEIHDNATNSGVAGGTEAWNVRLDEVTGTVTIANSKLYNAYARVLGALNHNSTSMTMNVTNSLFDGGASNSGSSLLTEAFNSATINLSFTGSTSNNGFNGEGVGSNYSNSSTGSFTVKNSLFDHNGFANGGGADINVAAGAGNVTFDIEGNTTRQIAPGNTEQSGISIGVDETGQATGASVLQGKILNNVVGKTGVTNSGSTNGAGIAVQTNGAGTTTMTISGNTVREAEEGIAVLASGTTDTLNVTMSGNDVSVGQTNPNGFLGVELTTGGNAGSDLICAHVSGNTQFMGSVPGGAPGIQAETLGAASIKLEGYGGATNNDAQIVAFLQTTATTVVPAANDLRLGTGSIGGASSPCPTPP